MGYKQDVLHGVPKLAVKERTQERANLGNKIKKNRTNDRNVTGTLFESLIILSILLSLL